MKVDGFRSEGWGIGAAGMRTMEAMVCIGF